MHQKHVLAGQIGSSCALGLNKIMQKAPNPRFGHQTQIFLYDLTWKCTSIPSRQLLLNIYQSHTDSSEQELQPEPFAIREEKKKVRKEQQHMQFYKTT